jgi:hypothetical protein
VALKDQLRAFFPFLRGPVRVPPTLLRSLHPVRNPEATWQREGESQLVVIFAPRTQFEGWKKALAKFIGQPSGRKIELSDEIASDVWELCDGQSTIGGICQAVAAKYQLGERQTEISVLQFLNMLRSRRLIAVPETEQKLLDKASDKKTSAGEAAARETQDKSNGNGHTDTKRRRLRRTRRH